MTKLRRKAQSTIWAGFLCLTLCTAALGADRGSLQITILEGEGSFNDIHKGIGHTPVVEVRDENGKVVENARVVFQLPEMGPGGTFADGSHTLLATTDKEGRASGAGLKPNRVEGPFHIIVTASVAGKTGHAEIRETNTLAGGDSSASNGHKKLFGILLGVGGAAGGIVIALARSGGGSTSSPAATATPTSLSAGTVTIGGPR